MVRSFWSLARLAARWEMPVDRLGEMAAAGQLKVGVMPIDGSEFVQVPAGAVMALTRETDPPAALVVGNRRLALGDLVVRGQDMAAAEDAMEILRRSPINSGPDPKYGWTSLLAWLVVHVHENGVPESQQALLDACRDWFEAQSPTGEAPTDRSIRRYVGPVWKQLRAPDRESAEAAPQVQPVLVRSCA